MKTIPFASLSKYSSFKTGGPAKFLVEVDNVNELREVLDLASKENLPYLVLGEGSNVLISDKGFSGYVIRPRIYGIEFDIDQSDSNYVFVSAGAGESWDKLVELSVLKNLSGIENLSLIPGSVGAAPVQNIGAYGQEIKDSLEWVEVFDCQTSQIKKITKAECNFGYRDSIFKHEAGQKFVILNITLRLKIAGIPDISYKDLAIFFDQVGIKKESGVFNEQTSVAQPLVSRPSVALPTIAEVREAVIKIRQNKLPNINKVGTAGSFFKNPVIGLDHFHKLSKKFPLMPSFPVFVTNGQSLTESLTHKKIPLAWILDKVCGLSGFRDGEVGLFETQPLAIVNYGNATTEKIKIFANKISDIVKEKTDIEVEWEVNLIE